jgi:hypothetical protein
MSVRIRLSGPMDNEGPPRGGPRTSDGRAPSFDQAQVGIRKRSHGRASSRREQQPPGLRGRRIRNTGGVH